MEGPKGSSNFMIITLDLFKKMVETLTPYLLKQITFKREPLEVELTLATTFHFLAMQWECACKYAVGPTVVI